MKTNQFWLILIMSLCCSCKKDKLTGEKEIFIGKWEWIYTSDYNYCDPDFPFTTILTPASESTTYTIEFYKKGKVEFLKDNEIVARHRVVFSAFGNPYTCSLPGYTYYGIWLDNDNDSILAGCVSPDTLNTYQGFPLDDSECHIYTNHFVRAE